MAVDKMHAVGEAGVLIDGDFAHDGVLNDIELASGERVGQKQIDGTGETVSAERGAPFGDLNAALGGGGGDLLDGGCVFGRT